MTTNTESRRRRFASWLLGNSHRATRDSRREWADAMSRELSVIDDDGEAVRWAVGCVLAIELSAVRQELARPTAFVPLVLSVAALLLVVGHAAFFGIQPAADEGTPAHIFQLLMAAQLPLVAFFAMRWLPEHPRAALEVLVLQGAAACAAITSVLFLT